MSDAKFKTYVVTDGENGDVFGNAKTMSDLRIFMHESDKKDARIRDLEDENEQLKKDIIIAINNLAQEIEKNDIS